MKQLLQKLKSLTWIGSMSVATLYKLEADAPCITASFSSPPPPPPQSATASYGIYIVSNNPLYYASLTLHHYGSHALIPNNVRSWQN